MKFLRTASLLDVWLPVYCCQATRITQLSHTDYLHSDIRSRSHRISVIVGLLQYVILNIYSLRMEDDGRLIYIIKIIVMYLYYVCYTKH